MVNGYIYADDNMIEYKPDPLASLRQDRMLFFSSECHGCMLYCTPDSMMWNDTKEFAKNYRTFNFEDNPIGANCLRCVNISNLFYLILYPNGILCTMDFLSVGHHQPSGMTLLQKDFGHPSQTMAEQGVKNHLGLDHANKANRVRLTDAIRSR